MPKTVTDFEHFPFKFLSLPYGFTVTGKPFASNSTIS